MNTIKYIAMDDADIKFYLPRAKILTYNQLAKVKDIEKLPQITTKMELVDSLICIDTF